MDSRAYSAIIDLCTVTLRSSLRIAFSDHTKSWQSGIIEGVKPLAINQKDHGFGGVKQNFKLLHLVTGLCLLAGILYLPFYTIVGRA